MISRKNKHLALYGRVAIRREYCNACQTSAFVIQGVLQCCDRPIDTSEPPSRYKRVVEPEQLRKLPVLAKRQAQIELQNNRCFYCDHELGSYVIRGTKRIKLRTHWDHQLPYVLTQNNDISNFVAACHICNGIKYCHVFQTVEEAKIYIAAKRNDRGYV